MLLHRWVMEQYLGRPLASHEFVRHACDNPPCFAFDHLVLGTHDDNMAAPMTAQVLTAAIKHLAGLDVELSHTAAHIAECIGAGHAETVDALHTLVEQGDAEVIGVCDGDGSEPWFNTYRLRAVDVPQEGIDHG